MIEELQREDMQMRNLSQGTQMVYVRAVLLNAGVPSELVATIA